MHLRARIAALACLATACCSAPAPQPTPPTPAPAAARPPAAAPSLAAVTPAAADSQWFDAPQTPGDWGYASVDGGTLARFGSGDTALFAIGCMAASRRAVLLRYGASSAAGAPMVIRTESADRALTTQPSTDGRGASAALAATDPLLDAMAFSKGRFAVEVAGAPPLYLPSWPEVTRAIEDCR